MPDSERKLLQRQSVNAKAIFVALALLIVGVALAAVTAVQGRDIVRSVVSDLGATLVGVGVVAILWELLIRRAFLKEVLAEVSVSEALVKAGIRAVGTDFLDPDWQSFYQSACELKLAFFQGSHTLTSNLEYIEAALRNGTPLEVILPDHDNRRLMTRLAELDGDPDSKAIKEKVRSTAERFGRLQMGDNTPAMLVTPSAHPFAVYLSDKVAILGLSTGPTFTKPVMILCEKGGVLYDFACRQYEAIRSKAESKPTAAEDRPTMGST